MGVTDGTLEFGLTAGTRPWLGELGPALTGLGYAAVWANDNVRRSGLATLAGIVAHAPALEMGLGVAPLSDRSPAEIASEARALGLPLARLTLGVGSGSSSSLALVRDGVDALRAELPGARIAISALGPRMCALGGEIADVVLLNWAAPRRIAWARERIAAGAAAAGREPPVVASYVRVAVGAGSAERLAAERAHYAGRTPRPYARLFAAQAQDPTPGVAADDPAAIPDLVAPNRAALDRCVIRGLPAADTLEGWLAVARAAAAPGRATLRA
jgi:alkanesulfonate monooxygenase SsuD/methylene tetrahydromethanopterin reductase-like flavin-dependent oxidoreductase (luciferase family)